ncbi:MAG: hypothetical protein ACP5HG_01175 [Anaerolineae bacterium]
MAYFLPLLLYLGVGGGLLLLGIGSISRLRPLREPLSAAWMTMLTAIWALSPSSGRWVLSVWAPSNVAAGWFIVDQDPAIWWAGLLIGAALSGALWLKTAERDPDLPLAGALSVTAFTIVWLMLASGSVLMTLAMWVLFDIAWFIAQLVGMPEGERVVWATALNGVTSLLLWAISLFLVRDGTSGLWWLMRPSDSILTLLAVAALMRVGFYPFQVVHAEPMQGARSLTLVGLLNAMVGIGLLYRLLSMPGQARLPAWMVGWGCLSVLWLAAKARVLRGRRAFVVAGYGALVASVTGGLVTRDARLLMVAAGAWVATMSINLTSRRYSRRAFYLSWAVAVSLFLLLGAPSGPFGQLYLAVLSEAPWVWRGLFALGLALLVVSLLGEGREIASGRVRPARVHLWMPLVIGLLLPTVPLLVSLVWTGVAPVGLVPFALWLVAVAAGVALSRWGCRLAPFREGAIAFVDLLDLQWLYEAAWDGAENLLGTVRVTAEVVEGSGSVLWSVLILLLVLVAVGGW